MAQHSKDDLVIDMKQTEPGYARLEVEGPELAVAMCFGAVISAMGADEEYEKKDDPNVSPGS